MKDNIIDRNEVSDLDALVDGIKRLNFDDFNDADISLCLRKTITSGNVSLKDFINALNTDASKALASKLSSITLSAICENRGEIYLRQKVESIDSNELISTLIGDRNEADGNKFLEEQKLLFLKPIETTGINENISKMLDNNTDPSEIVNFINEQVTAETPIDIVDIVAQSLFDKVFTEPKNPNLDIISKFKPLIQRSIYKTIDGGMNFVFNLQQKVMDSKTDKSSTISVVDTLLKSESLPYDAFDAWREDKSNKTKGKLPMLLKLSSYLDENRPKVYDEEYDEEEDEDEEIDEYLINPNAEYF